MKSGFEIQGLDSLIESLETILQRDLSAAIHAALEQMGEWLMRDAQRLSPIDTGRLYYSWQQGDPDNLWRINFERGVIQLQLGTDVPYSGWVEEGHWANPQGIAVRWVPGYWVGDKFHYDPTSNTGMALKQQWIPGYHMFEIAFESIEALSPNFVAYTIQGVLDRAAARVHH